MTDKIPSLREIKALRKPLTNVHLEHQRKLTALERLAIFITRRVGSMGFFLAIFGWTVIWLAWNTLAPVEARFDPFPAFVMWLFISNVLQLFLLPLLIIGQNLEDRYAQARAEADFQVNLQAERELETALRHLERHTELLGRVVETIEKKPRTRR